MFLHKSTIVTLALFVAAFGANAQMLEVVIATKPTYVTQPDNGVSHGNNSLMGVTQSGRYLAYYSNQDDEAYAWINNNTYMIKDVNTGLAIEVFPAYVDGNFYYGKILDISKDGRFVSFQSKYQGFAEVDQLSGGSVLYLKDMVSGRIDSISKTEAGLSLGNAGFEGVVSDDGQSVYFVAHNAKNLGGSTSRLNTHLWHRETSGIREFVYFNAHILSGPSAIDSQGKYFLYVDENDIYLIDAKTDSYDFLGNGAEANISNNGRFVVYHGTGGITRYDTLTQGHTVLIGRDSMADSRTAERLYISDDGLSIAFIGYGSTFLNEPFVEKQAFHFNAQNQTLTMLSVTADGEPANMQVSSLMQSADGSTVYFQSGAPNLKNHSATLQAIYQWVMPNFASQCEV